MGRRCSSRVRHVIPNLFSRGNHISGLPLSHPVMIKDPYYHGNAEDPAKDATQNRRPDRNATEDKTAQHAENVLRKKPHQHRENSEHRQQHDEEAREHVADHAGDGVGGRADGPPTRSHDAQSQHGAAAPTGATTSDPPSNIPLRQRCGLNALGGRARRREAPACEGRVSSRRPGAG